jgi:hypothetical protein
MRIAKIFHVIFVAKDMNNRIVISNKNRNC